MHELLQCSEVGPQKQPCPQLIRLVLFNFAKLLLLSVSLHVFYAPSFDIVKPIATDNFPDLPQCLGSPGFVLNFNKSVHLIFLVEDMLQGE